MKTVRDYSFRDLFHKACFIQTDNKINKVLADAGFQKGEDSTGVLAYGYIDYEAGFTFEVLCFALSKDDKLASFDKGNERISMKLRRGSVADFPVLILDDAFLQGFQDKVNMINNGYTCDDAVALTRSIQIIDPRRNEDYPDDIMVFLWAENLQAEGCWVRCTGIDDGKIIGKLLNEPVQDFGVHYGDIIHFGVMKQENGPVCLALLPKSET